MEAGTKFLRNVRAACLLVAACGVFSSATLADEMAKAAELNLWVSGAPAHLVFEQIAKLSGRQAVVDSAVVGEVSGRFSGSVEDTLSAVAEQIPALVDINDTVISVVSEQNRIVSSVVLGDSVIEAQQRSALLDNIMPGNVVDFREDEIVVSGHPEFVRRKARAVTAALADVEQVSNENDAKAVADLEQADRERDAQAAAELEQANREPDAQATAEVEQAEREPDAQAEAEVEPANEDQSAIASSKTESGIQSMVVDQSTDPATAALTDLPSDAADQERVDEDIATAPPVETEDTALDAIESAQPVEDIAAKVIATEIQESPEPVDNQVATAAPPTETDSDEKQVIDAAVAVSPLVEDTGKLPVPQPAGTEDDAPVVPGLKAPRTISLPETGEPSASQDSRPETSTTVEQTQQNIQWVTDIPGFETF